MIVIGSKRGRTEFEFRFEYVHATPFWRVRPLPTVLEDLRKLVHDAIRSVTYYTLRVIRKVIHLSPLGR